MDTRIGITLLALCTVLVLLIVYLLFRLKRIDSRVLIKELEQMKQDMEVKQGLLRQELHAGTQNAVQGLGQLLMDAQKESSFNQSERMDTLDRHVTEKLDSLDRLVMDKQLVMHESVAKQLSQMEERLKSFAVENEQKMEQIRTAMEQKLTVLQQENSKKLEDMRQIVDEKLQQSLEERMTKSFRLVSERLEQVYKGLGEMQNLAIGVGDLKKVLSNVKTRGILGEIQLGAILEEILSPEQYDTNVVTKKGTKNMVEYAIKLPTQDGGFLYMPIDAKFPGDTYATLRDAYEAGAPDEIENAAKTLVNTMRAEAKQIRDKYIDPPNTTEFAVMFLPVEGLYAEAVNRGLVELLQREYRVNIAGPSTMAALLNSLQMGFRSFAIQKRSSEVWEVLGAVKTEFDKFAGVLAVTQQRLEQANDELDKLVGVRTRQIQRKLKNVVSLKEDTARNLFEEESEE